MAQIFNLIQFLKVFVSFTVRELVNNTIYVCFDAI
jgi:hypothetical protein